MDEEKIPTVDNYIKTLAYLPNKMDRCLNLIAENYLADTQLKPYYIPYILFIKDFDGISQKNLKDLIPFDKSRISIVVRELMNMGLIVDSGTKRNSSLHLTDKGREAYSLCRMFLEIVKNELFSKSEFDDEEYMRKNLAFDSHLDEIIEKYSRKQ